ncbi:MAG: ATP-binding protein [Thermodesulfobacteriota bacterium]|nr:ATP-binding protein [Thermodesulfobacteriota bacterium]
MQRNKEIGLFTKPSLKMLQKLIGEAIELVWLPGNSLWPVKMDPSQVDQVLANLCVNARDAISGVGKITIETANIFFDEDYCNDHMGFLSGEYVQLAVTDNGCGIEKEILDEIFEPFFTTKELGKGTGLGLSTVYGIIKQNNGFINIYSEPPKGTIFRLYIPRHTGKHKETPAPKRHRHDIKGTETILLVEDEESLMVLGRKMLEALGYKVLTADRPSEAIQLAETYGDTIDLLITDVIMPDMNGHQLGKQLLSFYPDIKLLYISGYTADVITHQGVLEKGVCFLQKPFSRHDLSVKIRQALNNKQ